MTEKKTTKKPLTLEEEYLQIAIEIQKNPQTEEINGTLSKI